jgi:hypothetical protein
MTELEKIRQWLATYPGSIPMQLQVDYAAPDPNKGSIDPSGLIEVSRKEDILGNVTVENQLNFTLYFVLLKAPDDDKGAAENADMLMDFQRWVQEQSIRRLVPVFGDEPEKETAKAQNGTIYAADEEGTAMYTVQLAINFIKKYEVF